MKSFSDKDVRSLKSTCGAVILVNSMDIAALLARLEAAECAYGFHTNPLKCGCGCCIDWRRAAGK